MATVQTFIWLSMGTSTASVIISAQTISKNPAAANAKANDLFGSKASSNKADTSDSGIKTRIGMARLPIAVCPISRNVWGRNPSMLRLRANHVPQKTPITKANKMIVENCASFSFIVW